MSCRFFEYNLKKQQIYNNSEKQRKEIEIIKLTSQIMDKVKLKNVNISSLILYLYLKEILLNSGLHSFF